MDGIYSASRGVDEASLFEEARRLAGAEVTRRLSSAQRQYAERAIRKAQGFGSQYSVSPWTAFDFLCRIAAHKRHPGAYLHLLGLWPVAESAGLDEGALDDSRRFVDHLLGTAASGLIVSARIESLRLAEPTDEQRRDLEVFLHTAETQPLLSALATLADKKHLWVDKLRIESAHDVRGHRTYVSWRNQNGTIAKWSGLIEESDTLFDKAADVKPPVLILESRGHVVCRLFEAGSPLEGATRQFREEFAVALPHCRGRPTQRKNWPYGKWVTRQKRRRNAGSTMTTSRC